MNHPPIRSVEFDVYGRTHDEIVEAAAVRLVEFFDDPDFDLWDSFRIDVTPRTVSEEMDGSQTIIDWTGHVTGAA